MKSQQNAFLISNDTIFFHPVEILASQGRHSVFSLKREKNKSKFWIVNLCNGGTKDFVELGKLYIWKSELIFCQTNQIILN